MTFGPADLGSRIRRGLAWKAASQVTLQGSRIAVTVVLARLLAPHEFGLAAMVIVFGGLVVVFSDLALGAALVQRHDLSERDRSTVFWLTLAGGGVCTLLGILLSGLVAGFYGEPDVEPLFAALSLSFVVTALGSTQRALLTRDLDFRALELRLMISTFAGGALAIVVAARGHGAWAIVLQQVAVASTSTLLLWAASAWRPRFVLSWTTIRYLGAFSANVFGTRLLFYVSRNADNILVGRFLGASALGAYAIAYNVMLAPVERIAGPLQEVLFPAFSRLQDDFGRAASMWLRANRIIAAVSVPALVGFAVVAPDLVPALLGDKWDAAVPVVQILAFAGVVQSVQRLNSSVLQARDRTELLFRFSLLASAANVVAFGLGLRWGIIGVAACYAASNLVLQPIYTWVTAHALGVSLLDCARSLAGVFQASALMGAAVLAERALLVEGGVAPAARLALVVATGVVLYPLLCAWRAPGVVSDVRALRHRLPAPFGAVAPDASMT